MVGKANLLGCGFDNLLSKGRIFEVLAPIDRAALILALIRNWAPPSSCLRLF
jgi:hypothetical protein